MKARNKKTPPFPARSILFWILGFILIVSLYSKMGDNGPVKNLDYSDFKAKVAAGDILSAQIGSQTITGKMKNGDKVNKTREDIQDHRITYLFMLIPLGGLIYYLYNKDNYPLKASCALKGFIYNTVVLFFICIVLAIALN